MRVLCKLPLRGAGGEPISFPRTIHSHGCARLPPALVEESPLVYRRAFRVGSRVVEVAMRGGDGVLVAETRASLPRRAVATIEADIRRMFRFDADLSPFYARIADDEVFAWAASGAGRILASPSVFEDVVKTICTTNCAWSATIRMTSALAELGGGAFPEPSVLAAAPDAWFRDAARMGYRGPYVKAIARDVESGALDLEALLDERVSDVDVEDRLLALPGIGPYGAAHVMQLLGRHRRLILDSWTRPKYRRLAGKKRAADSTIRRAFARYGVYAGLAFWLYLTRDWLDEAEHSTR
ncbi:MAG: Fe-S cluster assembly protein HesB [Candidatus Eremiobacteraeota bacterium]|nr:Fe-S cluster assembly protein HesB [Candidatus Eremiobacteraeota bacterium]